jgi:hypothetical protein
MVPKMTEVSVVDPHYFDADPDADSTFHPDADQDPDVQFLA